MFSLSYIQKKMFTQVDASSIVAFRIGFGLIMLWEAWHYWEQGWISRNYIEPTFLFKYFGFEWVSPWGGDGLYYHFAALAILALFIILGAFYRLSTVLFTLAFSYIFLLDQAQYLNHFYMVILFSISLCLIPANRFLSVDAKWRPHIAKTTVPAWSVWLIRIQMEIILIYAGIVKINYDWLNLEPLAMWLEKRSEFPLFGPLFTQEWSVAAAAYGVIALHLIGAPLLLWKTTRIYVFFVYFCFHTLNHFVFTIGIFPWFTLFASLIFFDPDWPRQFSRRVTSWGSRYMASTRNPPIHSPSTPEVESVTPLYRNTLFSVIAIWIGFQVLFPLRHWLYPGNVSWTEEGHRFSWQMKLRDKLGKVQFFVSDSVSGKSWTVDPRPMLTRRQYRKMATRPDMILQFAHYLRDHWAPVNGIQQPQIYAEVYASLNGRRPALLIDPKRDLSKVKRDLGHADWILPLTEPFRHFDRW